MISAEEHSNKQTASCKSSVPATCPASSSCLGMVLWGRDVPLAKECKSCPLSEPTQHINIWNRERGLKPLLALALKPTSRGIWGKNKAELHGPDPLHLPPSHAWWWFISSRRVRVEGEQTRKNIECNVRQQQKTQFKHRKKVPELPSEVERTYRCTFMSICYIL